MVRRQVAGGSIFECGTCGCLFLYPSVYVDYVDSDWTKNRTLAWKKDVARGRRYSDRIINWYRHTAGRDLHNVLEVGCGTGFMGPGFRDFGVNYIGIDVDSESIQFAVTRGINAIELSIESLVDTNLGFPSFDLIFSSNALEHVIKPIQAFEAIKSASNGLIAIVVPNPKGLLPSLKANSIWLNAVAFINGDHRNIAYSIDGYWHNYAYTKKTLTWIVNRVGLEALQLNTIGINDDVFGFVQPNESRLYRLLSSVGRFLDMDSQLLLVAKKCE